MARKCKQSQADPDLPPRVAVWSAVSTKPQAARISPQEQYDRGAAFTRQIDGEIVRHYDVPGHTRELILWSEVEAIPDLVAYKQLREDLEARRLDVLWAFDMDRLGRDAALCQQVISLCERYGCRVYLSTTPHDLDAPQSTGMKYIYAIQAVRAEEEIDRLRSKLDTGMKGRVEGRGMFPNHPPFGYSPVRSPDTGKVVRYEFNEYIAGVDECTRLFLAGVPYLEIVRRLRDANLPTSSGAPWRYALVRRILHSDVYGGFPSWGEYRYKSETPSAKYPARWDAATYQAVVRERSRRGKGSYTRRGAGPYTGVAHCKRCGYPMARFTQKQHSGHEYVYLRCASHALRTRIDAEGRTCDIYNCIAEWRVTEKVRLELAKLQSPEALDAALDGMADTRSERGRLLEDLDRARAAAVELAERRTRLALDRSSGAMDLAVYQAADVRLKAELESVEASAAHAERTLALLPDVDRRRADLAALAVEFPAMIEFAEPAAVAAALQRAGVTIWIEVGAIEVDYP